MPKIEVCLSPGILECYDLSGKNVVVTDVLRATSTMVAGMDIGVKDIKPVSTVTEALEHIGLEDTLVAGERNGIKIDEFHLGNSPIAWMEEKERLFGKHIVMTTTNGTKAINMALGADTIYIGAFLNLDAVCNQLIVDNKDVLIVCAGWKNRVNMEDSLYGGAASQRLSTHFEVYGDAAIMMQHYYQTHRNNLFGAIEQGTHFKRLAHHGVEEDIKLCMKENTSSVVPRYKDGLIVV